MKNKLTFVVIAIIFILLITNTMGVYDGLFFYCFGTNVRIEIFAPNNTTVSEQGIIKDIILENGSIIRYENSGYNLVLDDKEVRLCESSSGDFIKFFGKGNNIYYVKTLWKDDFYALNGKPNSLIHNGSKIYCYDIVSHKTKEVLITDKHIWTIFVDDSIIVMFDSDRKTLICKDTLTEKVVCTIDLSNKIKKDVTFEVYDRLVKIKSDYIDDLYFDFLSKELSFMNPRK